MEYDVFISYSRKDYVDENKVVKSGNIVSSIKNVLSENGITFWFDEEGVYSGDSFAPLIAKHIKASKIFLFISSENSNASEWTSNEIAAAHAFKKKIIPFRYDDSVYNDSVILYIAKLDYIDYHNNPEKSLNRLVSSVQKYLKELKEKEETALREEKLRLEREQRKEERAIRLKSLRERIVALGNKKFSLKKDILRIERDLAELNNELYIVECELQNCRYEEMMLVGDALPGHNPDLFTKADSGQVKKEVPVAEEKSNDPIVEKRGRKMNLFSHYVRKHHIVTIVTFCLIAICLWGLSIILDIDDGGFYSTGLSLCLSLLLFQLFRLRVWAYPLLLAFVPWLSARAERGEFGNYNIDVFFLIFCLALMVLSVFFFLKKDGKSTWKRFRIRLLWKRLWTNIRQQPVYVRLYLYFGMLLGALLWIVVLDNRQETTLLGTVLAALYIYSLWLILRMKKSGLILLFLSLGFHVLAGFCEDFYGDIILYPILLVPILIVILLTSRSKNVWKTNWKKDMKINFSKNWDCIIMLLSLICFYFFEFCRIF